MVNLLLKITLLGTLILVLIFSGCLDGEENGGITLDEDGTATPGLTATDFSSWSEVDSEDFIDINLVVQNSGESKAENIAVNLYQHDDFTLSEGSWTHTYDSLVAADPDTGLGGEIFSTYWPVQAPTVSEDQFKSFKARVTYDYTSSSISNVYLVDRDELIEKGEEAFTTYTTSSQAPVTIYIASTPPVTMYEAAYQKKVTLSILIENTGSGVVNESNITSFKIKVDGADVTDRTTCVNYKTAGIGLFGEDQERSLRCDVTLSYSGLAVSHIVEAEIGYTYYSDTEPLTIEVKEVEGALRGVVVETKRMCCAPSSTSSTGAHWVKPAPGCPAGEYSKWLGECGACPSGCTMNCAVELSAGGICRSPYPDSYCEC